MDRELQDRLAALEGRLTRIEAKLDALADADTLRAELAKKDRELDALGKQGLHVVDMLDHARRQIENLKSEKA